MPNAKVSPIIFSTTSDLSAKYNKSQLPSQYANQSDDKNRTAFSEMHSSTVQKTHLRMAEEIGNEAQSKGISPVKVNPQPYVDRLNSAVESKLKVNGALHFSVKQSVEIKEAGKQESTNGGGNDTQPQNTSGGNETETGSSTIEGTSTQSTQGGLEGKVRDEHISEPEPNKRLNRLIIRRRSLLRKYARILRNLRRTSNLDNKTGKLFARRIRRMCKLYPRILRMNKRFAKFGGKWSVRIMG